MLESVIGHDQIKDRLSKSGTYLFYGPVSIGKRTTAFELSKAMLCLKDRAEGCTCRSCVRFDKDHPDFLCIGRYDRIKVADIDIILDFCSTAPFCSDQKITVIDNAHDMSQEAGNRLLKLLEEPPEFCSFFIITSDLTSIPFTLSSRCIKYEFGPLSKDEYTEIIEKKLGFEPEKARALGGIASSSSIEVFAKAGQCLKQRDQAVNFIYDMKTKPLIDSLDFIERIQKDDLEIFIDMLVLILTDMLLLANNIVVGLVNSDAQGWLEKTRAGFSDKLLMYALNSFSQIKKYSYLHPDYSSLLKNSAIKVYSVL